MKKFFTLIALFFLLSTNLVFASTSYTSTSWKTTCNDTPTSWDNDNSWQKWIPSSNNSSAPSSWSFDCTKHWYWNWTWSDYKNQNTIYNCPDKEYASKIICYNSSNNTKTCTDDWSWWSKYKIYCKKRDDTYPAASDLSSIPIDNWYLKATNSKNITITADANWWSPIVKIKWKYEKYDSVWSYNSEKVSTSDNNSSTKDKLETTENISLVDNNRNTNNYRPYNYKITEVCDEAWNCSNNVKTFHYNVYANNIDSSYSSITWINQLTVWNVAQAKVNKVTLLLRDKYNNKIVSVYRSDWTTIIRKVWVKVNYNNNLYLDQYKKSWNSWVKIKWFNDTSYSYSSIWDNKINSKVTSDKSLNTWNYITRFKVYVPTKNSYDKAYWNFTINSFSWYTYDNANNVDSNLELASVIDFKFNPIYYTNILWDIKNYWFIEWITQSWSINILTGSSDTYPSADLYIEFGSWARNQSPELNLYYKTWWTSKYNTVVEWYQTTVLNDSLIDSWINSKKTINLWTELRQKLWSIINSLEKQYFSTHIEYNIDWEKVIYNSDIIWRNNYWDSTNSGNTTQVWLKVLWKTYSKNQKDIKNNQNIDDIHILWNLTKSYIKKDFRSNIYNILKFIIWWSAWVITNLDWNNWSNNSSWFKMYNDKVLYFDVSWWQTVVLWNDTNETVKWRKTIIIKWWNLYIKSNMYYSNNSDILWIIVLKWDDWKWWNLYIDPDVTHIVWTIFVDKSILTAKDTDWDWEISSDEEYSVDTNQFLVANQLYINWQIFSENTIWGSRKNPPVCPYYLSWTCTLKKSQKYDLNYLRRYFIYDSNNNWIIDNWDIAANWWKNYKSTFDTSIYKYARYPVVIKYNPIIQISPPPLFDN